jgi:hypothetical protein
MSTAAPRTAPELLALARSSLARWTALWMPPVAMNAFESLASAPLVSTAAQLLVGGTANLASFIIEAGWLAMIGQALRGERPTWQGFKDGVNARWGAMIVGNLVFLALLAALAGAIAYAAHHQYPFEGLKAWYQGFDHMSPAEQQAALNPDKLPPVVRGWLMAFMGWVVSAAVVAFLLLFWQPFVVLAGLPWWKAFGASVRLAVRRFRQAFGLGMLNAAALFAGLTVTTSGSEKNPLPALLGFAMLLVAMAFFKVVYAAVVLDSRGELAVAPPPAEA